MLGLSKTVSTYSLRMTSSQIQVLRFGSHRHFLLLTSNNAIVVGSLTCPNSSIMKRSYEFTAIVGGSTNIITLATKRCTASGF